MPSSDSRRRRLAVRLRADRPAFGPPPDPFAEEDAEDEAGGEEEAAEAAPPAEPEDVRALPAPAPFGPGFEPTSGAMFEQTFEDAGDPPAAGLPILAEPGDDDDLPACRPAGWGVVRRNPGPLPDPLPPPLDAAVRALREDLLTVGGTAAGLADELCARHRDRLREALGLAEPPNAR